MKGTNLQEFSRIIQQVISKTEGDNIRFYLDSRHGQVYGAFSYSFEIPLTGVADMVEKVWDEYSFLRGQLRLDIEKFPPSDK